VDDLSVLSSIKPAINAGFICNLIF